jgi:hypothetical protein
MAVTLQLDSFDRKVVYIPDFVIPRLLLEGIFVPTTKENKITFKGLR